MIFRWSMWGKNKKLEMLTYSVNSFIAQFGNSHRYIIYTDNVNGINQGFIGSVEIHNFNESDTNLFNTKSKATWRKWCPSPRVDINQTEIYVDSDVFAVTYPKEFGRFLGDNKFKFAILDEFDEQYWQHGAMQKKNVKDAPFINAGLFIQKAGFDITDDLKREFAWWEENIKQKDQTHHDEQGALAIALMPYLNKGELYIFPKERYPLISDYENKGIRTLDDICIFHATWPEHPAFYRFKSQLDHIISDSSKQKTTAILMSVRDEESYIDFNISYHLDLGFDYIFIANHCSIDNTNKILGSYKDDSRVVVINEKESMFDHAKIANKLLNYANANYKIDWFLFLDVDEFLSINDSSIHDFVARLEDNNISYATIGWANALFDHTLSDYTCSPINSIDTTKYYYPWAEREWQEYGHFRKAIVKNHKNMGIVVSGHYVETGNNKEFFGKYHWNPFVVPKEEAKLLHFEFRSKAEDIYKKWVKMASFENDSTSDPNSPWMERIRTIRAYVKKFKGNIDEINKRWFSKHRTFWGAIVPEDRIVCDTSLSVWYRKYFRRKIESGKIKSVCLVRRGHLGDVIMTEPIARFLSKYVEKIYLATEIPNINLVLGIYDKIYKYSQIDSDKIDCDLKIRLIYELSDNKKTYVQAYMESIGFGEVSVRDIPKIMGEWNNIIGKEYILISPFVSWWEEKKRSWGYDKFIELSKLLEAEYGIKCVILEKHYSFNEMMSLVKHCEFVVGNDSGPAIIAQSFDKKSFIIFGATHPKYLHLSKHTIPIYDKNRHKLCEHNSRKEEMDCCEEFCMDRIRISDVFEQIKSNV